MVTLSDDSTIRIWRADGGCKTDKNHPMANDIIGTAEPTHREIGRSQGSLSILNWLNFSNLCLILLYECLKSTLAEQLSDSFNSRFRTSN